MPATDSCAITVDGVAYRIEPLRFSKRYFTFFGGDYHSHPDYHFIFVSGNDCDLLMRYGRRKETIPCPNHSIIFINPNHEHAFGAPANGTEHTSFIFTLRDAAGRVYPEPIERLFGAPAGVPTRPWRVVDLAEFEADEFIRQYHLASSLQEDGRALVRSAAMFNLFLLSARLVLREVFAPPPTPTRHDSVVATARAIIEGNYHAPDFNITVLANQLKCHPNHLNFIFRTTQKVAIREYLTRRRIHHARRLLAEGRQVKEVAFLCGYRGQSHFAALFRRRVGCTPRQYQERPNAVAGDE